MSAIITNQFRKNSRELFINDIEDSTTDDYFIGIGKTEPWPTLNGVDESNLNYAVPLPTNTLIEKEDTLKNLISLLKVEETFSVIPRNQWRSGRIYKVYDPYDPNIFNLETIGASAYYPCYMTHTVDNVDKIFVCLNNDGATASSVNPTVTTYASPGIQTDGYLWAYVCDLDSTSNFYTDQFVDIPADLTPLSSPASDASNATGGIVYGFKVVDGGSGVGGTEDIRLVGKDSTGAIATDDNIRSGGTDGQHYDVTILSGSITEIKITNDQWPGGYADASVIVDGIETDIRPLVAPISGFGFSPRSDLPSFYAGLFGSYEGNLGGEAPINVAFRQVSLVKGATRTDNDTPADASLSIFDTLQYLEFSNVSDVSGIPVDAGTVIEHQTNAAKAYLDYVDTTTNRVYYHQNSSGEINEKPFLASGNVNFTTPAGTTSTNYAISTLGQGEYNPGTGEAVFLENRKAILRNTNQQEDIKLVIQF
jgi:hypothetical protein